MRVWIEWTALYMVINYALRLLNWIAYWNYRVCLFTKQWYSWICTQYLNIQIFYCITYKKHSLHTALNKGKSSMFIVHNIIYSVIRTGNVWIGIMFTKRKERNRIVIWFVANVNLYNKTTNKLKNLLTWKLIQISHFKNLWKRKRKFNKW